MDYSERLRLALTCAVDACVAVIYLRLSGVGSHVAVVEGRPCIGMRDGSCPDAYSTFNASSDLSGMFGMPFSSSGGAVLVLLFCAESERAIILATRWIVLGEGDIDRLKQFREQRTCEWHCLNRAVVQGAVRFDEEYARLGK